MKMLITMKLADRNLKYHIYPMTLLEEIDKIMLVRDTAGPVMDKVRYYCPPSWTLRLPIIALFFKFLIMISLSIREKPSIVHAYLLFPHGILAFLTGKLTNTRCSLALIAGPMELYEPGRSPIYKYSYCKPLPKPSIIGRILFMIVKKFDVITVTGSYTENFLVDKGLDNDKIFILPHILNVNFNFISSNNEFDIVYVGRLARVKHIETLIKAVVIVKKRYHDVRVAIVGDGECRTHLERLTKYFGLTENINFVGYQADIYNWYNKGKISTLTSEREGFPYSVIESLSCGLPVVVSNCGDICDFIIDGYNGIIINDYRDYNSFAEAIIKLLQNPQLLKKYSINALKTSEQMDLNIVTNIWKNIIRSITKNERRYRSISA